MITDTLVGKSGFQCGDVEQAKAQFMDESSRSFELCIVPK